MTENDAPSWILFFFGVLSAINFMSGNKFYTSGDISLLDLVERENFFFYYRKQFVFGIMFFHQHVYME